MVEYTYFCDKCNEKFTFNTSVKERNNMVGKRCTKCDDGHLCREYNSKEFTFDMNKKIPPDLKLFLDKQKDNAKLGSIVDE